DYSISEPEMTSPKKKNKKIRKRSESSKKQTQQNKRASSRESHSSNSSSPAHSDSSSIHRDAHSRLSGGPGSSSIREEVEQSTIKGSIDEEKTTASSSVSSTPTSLIRSLLLKPLPNPSDAERKPTVTFEVPQ